MKKFTFQIVFGIVLLFLGVQLNAQTEEQINDSIAYYQDQIKPLENKVAGLKAKEEALKALLPENTKKWTINGTHSLLFGQSTFSNWQAGGNNNTSLTGRINYDFNYLNGKHSWNNKIIAGFGQQNQEGLTNKIEDVLNITSKYGYEFKKHWLFTMNFDLLTQFVEGFDYDTDRYDPISDFFAPATIFLGPAIDYKPSDNFWVSFSPAQSKFVLVLNDELSDEGRYGVDPGEKLRYELGANLTAFYRLTLIENIVWENRLSLYSNYLEDPQNVDIIYGSALNMKVNDYINAQLTFDAIYDDNAFEGFQIKQTFGVGLGYTFTR